MESLKSGTTKFGNATIKTCNDHKVKSPVTK